MQGNIRAAPRVRRGRQVVGVDFACDLEDADLDALRHFGTAGEPFRVGPALQHGLGVGVALVGLFLDVMELVEHQQRLLQGFGGDGAHQRVIQQIDQRADVVAAQHGAQQLGRLLAADGGADLGAVGHGRKIAGLDFGRVIDTGRHAMRDQVPQTLRLAGRGGFQQLDQFAGLLGGQG